MSKPYQYHIERTVLTYTRLWNVAAALVEQARKSQDFEEQNCLASIAMFFFSIEAYLNHLGEKIFDDWADSGQWSGPEKKLSKVTAAIGYSPDLKSGAWKSFEKMRLSRNAIGHGRTDTALGVVNATVGQSVPQPREYPKLEWEEMGTLKVAERILADATQMIRDLASHAQEEEPLLFGSETTIVGGSPEQSALD